MNKSLITNLLAGLCVVVGFMFNQAIVLSVGLFALSGFAARASVSFFDLLNMIFGQFSVNLPDKNSGEKTIEHHSFKDVINYFDEGDVMVSQRAQSVSASPHHLGSQPALALK